MIMTYPFLYFIPILYSYVVYIMLLCSMIVHSNGILYVCIHVFICIMLLYLMFSSIRVIFALATVLNI